MITVTSPRETHRAHLTDHDDGVYVVIRVVPGIRRHGRQVYRGPIDAPFHVVADRMAELLAELEDAL